MAAAIAISLVAVGGGVGEGGFVALLHPAMKMNRTIMLKTKNADRLIRRILNRLPIVCHGKIKHNLTINGWSVTVSHLAVNLWGLYCD